MNLNPGYKIRPLLVLSSNTVSNRSASRSNSMTTRPLTTISETIQMDHFWANKTSCTTSRIWLASQRPKRRRLQVLLSQLFRDRWKTANMTRWGTKIWPSLWTTMIFSESLTNMYSTMSNPNRANILNLRARHKRDWIILVIIFKARNWRCWNH